MKIPKRTDIHIVNRHSDLLVQEVRALLKTYVYNGPTQWQRFSKWAMLTLGLGFFVSGIVFFFAYNWEALHKFVKLGLLQGLLIIAVGLALYPRFSRALRNWFLTVATVLVGALLGVYGQIYQTGADAYDLFFAWTLLVSLWVWFSRFPALWLVYVALVNTTIILYCEQVASDLSFLIVCFTLFSINFLAFVLMEAIRIKSRYNWFSNILALSVLIYGSVGIISGIFGTKDWWLVVFVFALLAVYGLGLAYGYKTDRLFYFWAIPFSVISIVTAMMINISDSEWMFLLVSIFIISSVTFTVRNLIKLQKNRTDEN